MLGELIVPPWMMWAASAFAALAVLVPIVGRIRGRSRSPSLDIELQFHPEGGPRAIGVLGRSSTGGKPFMPPPAPLAASATDPGAEQRAAFRRVGNAVLIQFADRDGQQKPKQAWVIDRSRRGLRIAVESEVPVGGLFAVRPINAPPATPWSEVEIRHCEHADGHWEVGCRFRQPPPVQILMLYG